MKVTKQKAEIMNAYFNKNSINSRLRQIEKCGRVCYKSEDKITKDSYKDFIKGIVRRGHNSVLEMASVTLTFTAIDRNVTKLCKQLPKYTVIDKLKPTINYVSQIKNIPYPVNPRKSRYIITGNMRSFLDLLERCGNLSIVQNINQFLKEKYPILYLNFPKIKSRYQVCKDIRILTAKEINSLPDDLFIKHRFILFHIVTNRAVSHEIVRHRPVSYLQESQRYCRYGQGKFGKDVVFILPSTFYKKGSVNYRIWLESLQNAENDYLALLNTSSPQAARTVLPNSCKTEMMMFTNLEEWIHFLKLRCSKYADPSMRELANIIKTKICNMLEMQSRTKIKRAIQGE